MHHLFLIALFSHFSTPVHAQLDLHAHLDMKPGIGFLISGAFTEEPKALEWGSEHKTKATLKSFDASWTENKVALSPLIVVSLYAHPILGYTEVTGASLFHPESVVDHALEIEYQEILDFVKTHSARFGFARNADEAEKLIADHKTALVLSIEGAYGALETEEGFKKWVDDRGVAIVTPFHLTEDHFSGVALLSGARAVNSPYEFFKSLLLSGFGCVKTFCKGTMGIKPEGIALLEKLMRRKVWIDVAHSNEMDLQELLPMLGNAKLPLMVTHTQLREFYSAERGLGEAEIQYIHDHDGIIGLIPSEEMIDHGAQALTPQGTHHECTSSLDAFRETVATATQKLGAEKVTLGSDINAPLPGLSPSCDPSSKSDIRKDSITRRGFFTYSQWPELARHVTPTGLTTEEWNKKTLDHFLTLWREVRTH